MTRFSLLLTSLLFIYNIVTLQSQLIPDCDIDFLSSTIDLIQSHIDDQLKYNHIKSILSSCNKSRMQKLTEISVFLLDKGIFPSRVVEDIRRLANTLKKERLKRIEDFRGKLPSSLNKKMDELSSIVMNNSLSGNEKLPLLSNSTGALPRKYRRLIESFLNEEAGTAKISPKTIIDKDVPLQQVKSDKYKLFPMKKHIDRSVEERTEKNQGNLPRNKIRMDDLSTSDSSTSDVFRDVPSTVNKENNFKARRINITTKNHRRLFGDTSYIRNSTYPPRVPIMPSNAGLHSYRMALKYTTTTSYVDQMDDADLLNPRTSLLSDAVRLLEGAIPRVKLPPPRYRVSSISKYAPSYTVPLSEETYGQSIIEHHNQRHNLLPSRDDSTSSSSEFSTNPTTTIEELRRYNTNIDRFASIHRNRLPLPKIEMESHNDANKDFMKGKSIGIIDSSRIASNIYPNDGPDNYLRSQARIFVSSSGRQHLRNPTNQIDNSQNSSSTRNLLEKSDDMFSIGRFSSGDIIAPRPKHHRVMAPQLDFQAYRNLHELNGSYVARDLYNLKRYGQQQFTKIDRHNE